MDGRKPNECVVVGATRLGWGVKICRVAYAVHVQTRMDGLYLPLQEGVGRYDIVFRWL